MAAVYRNKVTREQVSRKKELRQQLTPSEQKVWELVRNRRCLGLKFRRQRIADRFYVDFYCASHRLVLEVDGGIHDQPEQKARDVARTARLGEHGLRVVRIRNEEVSEGNLKALLRAVLGEIP